MKTPLTWIGSLLLVGLVVSSATADNPPSPSSSSVLPACDPCCTPMSCSNACCDPCAGVDPCKSSCNIFKNWFHHEPKVKEVKIKDPKGNGPNALNSPVFPVHPFARSPRDFFMLD